MRKLVVLMKTFNIILTCDGGNGHKSAAQALESQAKALHNKTEIINTTRSGWHAGGGLDISDATDYLFTNQLVDFGPFAVKCWDWAQRNSQIELLRVLASLRKISFLSIPVFRYKMYELLNNLENRDDLKDCAEIVFHNTQPNCLHALVYSVAKYNRAVKAWNAEHPNENPRRTVKYVNYFTDLPTLQAKMFMEEIAKINVADLDDAQFELHTRPPLVDSAFLLTNPSQEDMELRYHQKAKKLYPNLYKDLPNNTNRVKFVDGPIRKEFLERKKHPAERKDGLSIQFKDKSEFDTVNRTLGNSLGDFNESTLQANMPLTDDVEIASLMLGSQASIDGTLSLVNEEINFSNQHKGKIKYLYVFCGDNKPQEGLVLYQKVLDIAQKVNSDPSSNIRIIPLSNQPASMIADVYSLADKIITRPGGISIMEIEAVSKRAKIFVFTELSKGSKFFNMIFSRSFEALKKEFSKQRSEMRFSDLIAWESGNAIHAQNACRDISSRTRVVPVNIYTYQKELEFNNKKENLMKLIQDNKYNDAFTDLNADPLLNSFFLTGDDLGVYIASLVEITQIYDRMLSNLEKLITKHYALETLKNGPKDTMDLIRGAKDSIAHRLNAGETPSDILKDVLEQINAIQLSLDTSIETVKLSSIENKPEILQALEFISRAFLNFFRFIWGINKQYKLSAQLQTIKKDIQEIIKRPSMKSFERHEKISDAKLRLGNPVAETEWEDFEKIIAEMFTSSEQKKTIILRKENYPQLKHDFIYYVGSGEEPVGYVISKEMSNRHTGVVSFLQNRLGEPIVMKEHHIQHGLASNLISSELKALEKMGFLVSQCEYPHANGQHESDFTSLQKYCKGQMLTDYLIKDDSGFFVTYKTLSEEIKIKLAISLLAGLKQVIDKGIIHGDIQPANILVQEKANNQFLSTFIDFGLAQVKGETSLSYRPYISPYYGAPELLLARSQHSTDTNHDYPYSEKSDIYSLGVMLKDIGIDPILTQNMRHEDPNQRPDVTQVIHELTLQLNELEDSSDLERNPSQFSR